jgi:ribose 5-phosphate isomerase B
MTEKSLLYIASDHAGFEQKAWLKEQLSAAGYQLEDLGVAVLQPDDDYPQYGFALAERVAAEPDTLGILLCGSGQGICVAANKVNGARAVSAFSPEMAASTRNDDHANILCLPARFLSNDEVLAITKTWLETPVSNDERHVRRVTQIQNYELK